MNINKHNINGTKIAEIISDEIVINSIEDGLNLMADCYYATHYCRRFYEIYEEKYPRFYF